MINLRRSQALGNDSHWMYSLRTSSENFKTHWIASTLKRCGDKSFNEGVVIKAVLLWPTHLSNQYNFPQKNRSLTIYTLSLALFLKYGLILYIQTGTVCNYSIKKRPMTRSLVFKPKKLRWISWMQINKKPSMQR